MHINPYGHDPVCLAADLANHPPESVDELVTRCLEAGLSREWTPGPEDLVRVRALLARWTDVVDADPGPNRAERLNVLLASGTAHPRLTDHDGHWHLHYRDADLSLAGVLHALIATGTAMHLAGRGMDRLGRCAVDECRLIYADTSRTGRRRYCSTRCANRDGVRRHRARAS
ncbi:CGNR zinc finger domain-containing protein [Pseudonocardia sp. KRD291]|uniref:CGNR zinc finger domain-containing protein n=1 Tax=Pseudonocardia sp. KRD291 TaxID=2792007 RepID=UPI001C5C6ED6|nr:CGNR zinc finger domain-containing protein [Pseudonocardia sp. KRD291]MBW0104298.1 CGNR zinc finger domain-containing protein [Pseudonocardia sp. KRD291]